ncbi:MAG TPA: hypothetical protein VML55_10705 [Planctomycetaceae bacterium]|nr:hypothetical protein [Planctomycetaceae bacterium]
MTTPDETGTPGKTRTWWHPLLVRVVDFPVTSAFEVRDEMSLGSLPLRADLVLMRREQAEVPELARRWLPTFADRFNRWTIVEFKSPVDALERCDLDRLLAIAHLFRAQRAEPITAAEMSLVFLAPSLTKSLEADVASLGLTLAEETEGVWRIEGGLFTTWLLETDRLAGPDEPVLTIFSRVFLRNPQLIMELVRNPETQPILWYVFQQIGQFQQMGDGFMVQHTHTAEMDQEYAAIKEAFAATLTPEERVAGLSPEERVAGLSPDERLAGLSPDERLAGLSPWERVAGLTPDALLDALSAEERKRLFERLREQGFGPE